MIQIADPKLADKIAAEFSAAMTDALPWLTTAYGKIEKRERGFGENKYIETTKRQFYPAYPNNDNESYINLFPDENLGNYSYMEFLDPQGFNNVSRFDVRPVYKVAVVFWFDFRKVYESPAENTIENVKAEVLNAIKSRTWINSKITVEGFLDRPENIYYGFYYEELSEQSHMRPFGGFRMNIIMEATPNCFG